jgi:hypothetical protein
MPGRIIRAARPIRQDGSGCQARPEGRRAAARHGAHAQGAATARGESQREHEQDRQRDLDGSAPPSAAKACPANGQTSCDGELPSFWPDAGRET